VNNFLTEDGWIGASNIEVIVSEGEVTLTGTVDSRSSKRRAEDVVDGKIGVKLVQNNLRYSSTSVALSE
jgi:osmotically-inducible protein OsmY